MKMVSSAKLHKAQSIITGMVPYEKNLERIASNFLSGDVKSPFAIERTEPKGVAIVAFSSNSALCGSFNSNVIKTFKAVVKNLVAEGIAAENITVYPIGKKIEEEVKKEGLSIGGQVSDLQQLAAKPDYKGISGLARGLMSDFLEKTIDRVIVIYHHFKSAGVQTIVNETYLPIDLSLYKKEGQNLSDKGYYNNYIIEPSVDELVASLIPQVLLQKLYTCLADSYASEHAARTIAMQVATDNADELLQELNVLYNKTRQQAITAELLDIVSGSC